MQKKMYFPMTLIAVALISGCSSVPQNSSLTAAHNSYDSARTNPEVTKLAAAELQVAGNSLSKADAALKDGESDATVNQLAYITQQQVAIAQQTAQRKTAELAVAAASAKRNEIQLQARTAEVDVAHQQTDAANQQTAMVQQTADQQAAALVVASNQAASDQALIAQQDAQLQALNAVKTERGMVITLGDVLFNTNKAQLSPRGMSSAQKLTDFLKQYPQRKIRIEGYTDSTGSEQHNQMLSERRADAVRSALLDMGVNSDRITTHGYGESYPVAGNNSAAHRQLNRRVEIIVSDGNGNIVAR
jgi:outer membrane protein OmpA-like peptidoglycan-associated protein